MLNLTRAIDRANGYIFIPPTTTSAPPGTIPPPPNAPKPNTYALFSTAAGPLKGKGSDVRDVQERWIDAKEEWDAFEKVQWRKEGEALRDEAARNRPPRVMEKLEEPPEH
jgi:GPN-loop GTPase